MDIGGLEMFCAVSSPDVSRDGSFAVFSNTRPLLRANSVVGQIWRIELPEGSARPLTRGIQDRLPAISPDGSRVAYLRKTPAGTAQIHVIEARGGEPVIATGAPLGVHEFKWSPDGKKLAYTARVPDAGRYGTDDTPPRAEAPRRITSVRWKADALGYLIDRPAHIFLVDAPDLAAEPDYPPASGSASASQGTAGSPPSFQLTHGQNSHTSPCFNLEGSEVYCLLDTLEPDRRDLRSIILALAVDGSGSREILTVAHNLAVSTLAVSPPGELMLLAHSTRPDGTADVAPPVGLWRLDVGGPALLTEPDSFDGGEYGTQLSFLGDTTLVQHRTRGRLHLVSVDGDGATHEQLAGDVEVVSHASCREVAIASVATSASPGDLVLAAPDGPETLVSFAHGLRHVGLSGPRETVAIGRSGYPVHGWIHLPAGSGPHPVVLSIHGGPNSAFTVRVSDERQVLVGAGYAVVYCNPRGSAGYGLAHAQAVRHSFGTVDMYDVLDFLDAALATHSSLDPSRMAIMGGSYGGFLTAWTIAHDHRFRAAIVERGFLDPESFRGTSDIGAVFVDQYLGADPARVSRQSALRVVAGVRTPTLIIHSEDDHRCPPEQGTNYYSALKRQGVPAELLLFPGENHGLGRGGQPRHRVQRLEAIVDWLQRHLSGDAPSQL